MTDALPFAFAMWDAFKAAMIGLNPVPALIISLVIGMGQAGRGGVVLKAMVATMPAVLISALWPEVYGARPIWPDLGQIEVEIQIGVLYILCLAVIRAMALIKPALSFSERQPKKA